MVRQRKEGSSGLADSAVASAPWTKVVGQYRIRQQLAEAVRSGRAPHACLFSGPAGIGKSAVAIELACLLLCDNPESAPCGTCPQCAASRRLEHPDLHLIFPLPSVAASGKKGGNGKDAFAAPASSTDEDPSLAVAERIGLLVSALAKDPYTPISLPRSKKQKDDAKTKSESQIIRIEQIRSVIRWASLKPFSAARKIFVIFSAETMNPAAQNALLKALEEPAPEAFFLLITDSETILLPTIRSRCQRIRMAPLGLDEIRDALVEQDVPAERAAIAAAVSAGRYVRARELAASDLDALQDHTIAFLRAAAKCDPAMIQEAAEKLSNTGDLPEETALELLGLFLRDVALRRAGKDAAPAITFGNFETTIEAVLSAYPQADFETAARAVDESATYLAKGYTQELVLWALAIRLHDALGTQAPAKPKPPSKHA